MTDIVLILLAIIWVCLFFYICSVRGKYNENNSSKMENSVELEKFRNENYDTFLKSKFWKNIEIIPYSPEPHDHDTEDDDF